MILEYTRSSHLVLVRIPVTFCQHSIWHLQCLVDRWLMVKKSFCQNASDQNQNDERMRSWISAHTIFFCESISSNIYQVLSKNYHDFDLHILNEIYNYLCLQSIHRQISSPDMEIGLLRPLLSGNSYYNTMSYSVNNIQTRMTPKVFGKWLK